MNESRELESVDIPSDVLARIEDRVGHTEFDDANEYIIYVLEEVLHTVAQETDTATDADVDEQQVEERLKSLGYLNE
ncbi:hypothetical protein [Halorientalis marina]|uniref:hypothetical protein n=1 Tax=Halorientalis marina TaxID=2931976 RepID=UPI001FF50496|nr:hypothetical protein [Halorientalis marina]